MKKISYDSWKIVLACKGYSNIYDGDDNVNSKQVLEEYLEDYLLIPEINYGIMYRHLLNIIFEIFNKEQIFQMFDNELAKEFFFSELNRKKNSNFYSNICTVFIRELRTLDVMKDKEGIYQDLYSIVDKTGNILTIEEANKMWIGKDKYPTLVKNINNY